MNGALAGEQVIESGPSSPEVPARNQIRIDALLQRPFPINSIALTTLCLFAWVSVVYLTRSVLLPLVVALLLSYLLVPVVRVLQKARIPALLGSALVLGCLLCGIGYTVVSLATPALGWMEKAPTSFHQLQTELWTLRKPMDKMSAATAALEKITSGDGGTAKPPQKVEIEQHTISTFFLNQTPEFLGQLLATLILLYFLLAYDGLFLGKLIKVTPRLTDKKRAVTITREIEHCVSRYLLTITCINVCLGAAVGTVVGLLGMPNPVLWGVMAAILNFVPYLGATVGICVLLFAALITFPAQSGWALTIPAAYLVIAILEGNFITPLVLGRSLTLNPIVIVVALMFWGWMWGVVGAVVAVPILAAFKILCDHIEALGPIGEFLSG